MMSYSFQMPQGIEDEFAVSITKSNGQDIDEIIKSLIRVIGAYNFSDGKVSFPTPGFYRNGGRIYVDVGHLEIATPVCSNGYQSALYTKASEDLCELIKSEAMNPVENSSGNSYPLSALKNLEEFEILKSSSLFNSKNSGDLLTTRGTHENYLVLNDTVKFSSNTAAGYNPLNDYNPEFGEDFVKKFLPYLIERIVFSGAGGYYGKKLDDISYCISPRVMFSEFLISSNHNYHPVLSLKNEPFASHKFFRLHVTSADPLRLDYANIMRNSVTSFVLRAIETGYITNPNSSKFYPDEKGLSEVKKLSKSFDEGWSNALPETALNLKESYLAPVEKMLYESTHSEQDLKILKEWENILLKLENGSLESLVGKVEWITKIAAIENYMDNSEVFEGEKKSDIMDRISVERAYSCVSNHEWFEDMMDSLGVKQVFSPEQLWHAMTEPPAGSRSWLITRLSQKYRHHSSNWNEIKFDSDREVLGLNKVLNEKIFGYTVKDLEHWTEETRKLEYRL